MADKFSNEQFLFAVCTCVGVDRWADPQDRVHSPSRSDGVFRHDHTIVLLPHRNGRSHLDWHKRFVPACNHCSICHLELRGGSIEEGFAKRQEIVKKSSELKKKREPEIVKK